jgi:hypothetical protein
MSACRTKGQYTCNLYHRLLGSRVNHLPPLYMAWISEAERARL